MKTLIVMSLGVVVAGLGWWLASSENRSDRSYTTYRTYLPDTTITDPASIFQKAFWKRPTDDDHILHAQRREWADKDGLTQWQWFISVQPSPALVDHLITDNAFSLTLSTVGAFARTRDGESPKWFPTSPGGFQTFTNSTGTFILLWDKKQNLLHATDSGRGFTPGAPTPLAAPVVSQTAQQGRLPRTPPPRP